MKLDEVQTAWQDLFIKVNGIQMSLLYEIEDIFHLVA